MSGSLSTNTLHSIYNNTFQKYLMHSDAIGGTIFEQSVVVHNIFKTTLELVQGFNKYRKPLNPVAEQYLTDPLFQEIEKVKSFEGRASDHIFQITLISKSIKIFEWVREMDTEKFATKLNKYIQFYQQKAQAEIESLNRAHFELMKSWNETYEEFSIFVVNFFKNGVEWSGNASMPLNYVLGDTHIAQQTHAQQALLGDINQGLQNVLHHRPQIATIPEEATQVFTKKDQKWLIQNQKDNHNIIVNTARKEEHVLVNKCDNCTIVIENLINLIHVDLCNKVTILFRHTRKVEAAECKDCSLHCFDKLGSLDMLSCENCGVYLSDKSLDVQILTTKCSGIIVKFPFEDGIYKDFKISDQLITKILPNKGIETIINKA